MLFSSCGDQGGPLSSCGMRVSHHGGFSCCGTQALGIQALVVAVWGLSSCGCQALEPRPVVVVHELSCSAACEIFLDQGLNPYPLHWQGISLPLSHQKCPSSSSLRERILLDQRWPLGHHLALITSLKASVQCITWAGGLGFQYLILRRLNLIHSS